MEVKQNMEKTKVNKNYEIKLSPTYFNVGDEIIFEKKNDGTVRMIKKC